ncbi:MAG: hypothetical protein IKJ19_04295 [Clostridia bacterium]|nr:hypothetical protein [Clostridia bacterium]
MKHTKFSIISDSILSFCITFIISYVFLSLMSFSKEVKIAFGLVLALCLFLIVIKFKSDKYNLGELDVFEKKAVDSLMLKLETTPDNEVIEALNKILAHKNVTAQKVKNHLESKTSVYIFNFDKQTSRTKICYFLRGFCNKKIYLFCNKTSDDSITLLKNFKHKITVFDSKKVYKLFKEANIEMITKEEESKTKSDKFKIWLNKVFTKKRAINFTLIAGCLLLFSTFTFFPLYYRICALISAFLAVICLIFGTKEERLETNSLSFDD